MEQVQVGQIVKALDFGIRGDGYIIGEVTYTNSIGEIEGKVIQRVVDNKDVTGVYDDGFFTTYQNGECFTDTSMGPRLSVMDVAAELVELKRISL